MASVQRWRRRTGLPLALLAAAGFTVIGEARNGMQAVAETARLRPDVVLLDIQLPDVDGFAVARCCCAAGIDQPS